MLKKGNSGATAQKWCVAKLASSGMGGSKGIGSSSPKVRKEMCAGDPNSCLCTLHRLIACTAAAAACTAQTKGGAYNGHKDRAAHRVQNDAGHVNGRSKRISHAVNGRTTRCSCLHEQPGLERRKVVAQVGT